MTNFFCADSCRKVEEDIIGSGTNYQTYILIECPTPWASEAFESKSIPQNLKNLVDEVKQQHRSVRFLLIAPDRLRTTNFTKVLIFDNKQDGLSRGYHKKEFNVETLENVADIVRKYLAGETPNCEMENSNTRDILVCTHGSHDKCCARYGIPFYMQALATVSDLSLSHVRIWKASHFGGHRFAPTIIDFPEGRYYGILDRESFKSILTRTGDIKCLNRVYRGWGLLPIPIQVMERELILQYGWDWFNYKVAGKIFEPNLESKAIQAEITLEKPNNSRYVYRADIVEDEIKTIRLRGSCNSLKESKFVKYSVENLQVYSAKRAIKKHEDVRNSKVVKRSSLRRKSKSFVKSQSTKPSH